MMHNGVDLTDPDEDREDVEEALNDLYAKVIAPHVNVTYSNDDEGAHDQSFNDWTDGLCKDGMLDDRWYNECARRDGPGIQ